MMRVVFHVLLLAGIYAWSMAPVVSFIQQTSGGASVLEVCTPDGFAKVALNDGPAGADPGTGNPVTQIKCPFCTVVAFGGAALDAPDLTAWRRLEYPPQTALRIAARDVTPVSSFDPGRAIPARAPPVTS